jgi:hypothetical protein
MATAQSATAIYLSSCGRGRAVASSLQYYNRARKKVKVIMQNSEFKRQSKEEEALAFSSSLLPFKF